ncbi:hypothetical protein C8J56DRAFT_783235 [Mycena floridula]|nr:hypothetical protein C8J56DRAFT_783235 [Mycena floridula]
MQPVILVTGASRGLGLAIVRILLNEFNARVIGLARSPVPIQAKDLVSVQCDMQDQLTLQLVFRTDEIALTKAINEQGKLDAIILNAGTLDPLCRIGDETPLTAWKTHFEVNFFSLITAIKAALPALRSQTGRIVFVSSGAAVKGTAGWGPYNASKAAMNSLCRTLAEEEPNVTSIALRPGTVDTGMQLKLRDQGSQHMNTRDWEGYVAAHADKKLLAPELPAKVIAALALKAPNTLSGQFLNWNDQVCQDLV